MNVIPKESVGVVETIVRILFSSGIVVVPTDTVYGMTCDANDPFALEKLYEIKGRDSKKPLPLFVSDGTMAKEYVVIDPKITEGLKKVWPGAFTGVFPAVTGEGSIGIRIPNSPLIRKIAAGLGNPIVGTSANISGQPELLKTEDIIRVFGDNERVDMLVDGGDLVESAPSTVVDFTTTPYKILREGPIKKDQLEEAFGVSFS